jgi:hypothetical protein
MIENGKIRNEDRATRISSRQSAVDNQQPVSRIPTIQHYISISYRTIVWAFVIRTNVRGPSYYRKSEFFVI